MVELEASNEQHKTQRIGHELIVQNQGPALELFMSQKLLHIIHSLKTTGHEYHKSGVWTATCLSTNERY